MHDMSRIQAALSKNASAVASAMPAWGYEFDFVKYENTLDLVKI